MLRRHDFEGCVFPTGWCICARLACYMREHDVHRYQCFADQKEFEQQVQRKQPHKIDIGAVFTIPPKVRHRIGRV